MPGVEPAHAELEYWRQRTEERLGEGAWDEPLLTAEQIRALNESMRVPREGFYGQVDLMDPLSRQEVVDQLFEREEYLATRLENGVYVAGDGGGDASVALSGLAEDMELDPEHRVALGDVPFYCAPTSERFFERDSVLPLDRNRCSTARSQEPIEVLGLASDDFLLARARYTWGFIPADAPLSPALSSEAAERFVRGPHVTTGDSAFRPGTAGAREVPPGSRLPVHDGGGQRQVYVAGERGVAAAPAPDGARDAERPFTRAAVLEEAFSLLGTPYGFGGEDGGRDCSRYLLDVFETFGIEMPRHSGWQADAGSFSIDVKDLDEDELLPVLDEAEEKGVVLLAFPGHIMLYLGREEDGRPMAIHALAEYLEPCDDGEGEITVAVDTVQVSDLELGRHTSRGALIERVERIAVLGAAPGVELAGVADVRPAAPVPEPAAGECTGGDRLLVTPAQPGAGEPVRIAAATESDPGAAELAIFGPTERDVPEPIRTGGPPYGWISEIEDPEPGSYTAVLGDGDQVYACRRFEVGERVGVEDRGPASGPIWNDRNEWDPAHEDLFSVFVERLFDYSIEEDLTWTDLNEVVADRERNLLYGYLGRGEEDDLNFVPDCAELPYTLRAYFAWKLELPFGYHGCSRARDNRPPQCGPGGTNEMSRSSVDRSDDVHAFQRFIHNRMRSIVHSSAGRTVPEYEDSDYYPVPLTREALRPGTTFIDPYGHLIVLTSWIPQTHEDYGILIGSDAQPDGTVGMRRFWRGSFLFIPETHSGGAGFKAFRPWRRDGGRLVKATNEELKSRPRVPHSLEQYEGSEDDFYDAMNALINPRPLDADSMMASLVDALDDEVARRVNAVENGEEFLRGRSFRPIDMPYDSDIFLTTGPWENYSTPSRDWRLLASMDTVAEFPDAVKRNPDQFQLSSDDVDAEVRALRERLDDQLASRSFTYERSDGSDWELTLKDVIDRIETFEMSWNPNDCPEVRWAAPEGSEERETCDRRAPAPQRERMADYRPWFTERSRPAR